ncbi:MAG: signal recognition particle protein, partial [Candidatus Latescibacterota bacterium]
MFEALTERLDQAFRKLRGRGKLTEGEVDGVLREVRRALLEADVHYRVVKEFIGRVRERAVGQEVMRSITPGQQVVKVVYEELIRVMGGEVQGLSFSPLPPTVVLLVGLQGSGKTTAAAKLARYLKERGHHPMLVAADLRRPAAVEQLEVLGRQVGVPVYREEGISPEELCRNAVRRAIEAYRDVVLVDTAGRLHIDEEMMAELRRVKEAVDPHEVLLVVDAMTGQDAVHMAQAFSEQMDFTGVFLTKLDGDARGGAALSVRAVTGRPIKFVGVGERTDDIEPFHPDRMASRILGMGDVATLVEKVERAVGEEQVRRAKKEEFTLEDFLEQIRQVRKMGPLDQLLGMLPGAGKALKGL